ncbi:SAVED domain-containing protein [Lysinibacillus sp. NPDC093190]|uniref:SAVED domain-containing protein n=1 Tax=Lysinibacillus sp. NPDC093190 TaxID=3390575 RepID=UPI003D02441C
MSVSYIPESVKMRLWGKAAGRCQYEGCNKPLWLDSLTQCEFNTAYIAHIIADKPRGPRGHETLSEQLASDITNLMLMCDDHHRLIDKQDVDGHPVERLCKMKKKHEERIELVTSITENMKSHVLLYGGNIGEHTTPLNWKDTTFAMLPNRYPDENHAIELSLKNSSFYDNQAVYWTIESEQLKNQFRDKVKGKLESSENKHLSVFALAPQPLLILLGTLISDLYPAEVYQLGREPQTWKWRDEYDGFEYEVIEPIEIHKKVAINLSLSATIDNSRITNVIGGDTSIWTITIPSPNPDFLKGKNQLRQFRVLMRGLFNKIKLIHGEDSVIHIFPATSVSTAVELGRVWMSKADLPLSLYDENKKIGGFQYAFSIGK